MMSAPMPREPVEVWPLASFLADEMEARGWTAVDVGLRMGGSEHEIAVNTLTVDFILAVQEDDCYIGDDTFDALAFAFDVSAEFFRNLDRVWREWPDRRVPFEAPEKLFSGATTGRHT